MPREGLSERGARPSYDPKTGWATHFRWNGVFIVGRTAIGRTTVQVLNLNSEEQLELTAAVEEIIGRIEQLPDEERSLLEERLAELEEAAWKREAEKARASARARGIDQSAIDQAVQALRYPS